MIDSIPGIADRASNMTFSQNEIQRYSRHLIMPEVGMTGQKKLKSASILLIGAGGLGSPLGLYLAAAGIGRLGLVDFDVVDHSNLQRQVLHTTADVGRPKLQSAAEHLQAINPEVALDLYETHISSANAMELMEPYDIVIDGTDNFPTRYLVNDACVLLGKPNVYGSIFRFDGQASVFHPPHGPCYRCLFPEPPPPGMVPSCAEGGVLGILPGTIGVIQATEAVKLILGTGKSLIGRLMIYDALDMTFREMKIRRNPECPLCGENPTIKELIDYEQFCGIPSQQEDTSLSEPNWEISVSDLHAQIQGDPKPFILDVRNPVEYEICKLPESVLIPLSQLPQRTGELDPHQEIIVHCKTGQRSAQAVEFLREAGFQKVKNLLGGIEAWAEEIDADMPTY
ncbi:MAG: molybdopterin-synthase adenylyltransferase MoeB [Planctomycetota bacterium]|nr:molybdopterin-synthase adenylyltransferase MoeB [Planctomycetota bacterium]